MINRLPGLRLAVPASDLEFKTGYGDPQPARPSGLVGRVMSRWTILWGSITGSGPDGLAVLGSSL